MKHYTELSFAGTATHGLDPKNRIFIPVDYREDLGEKLHIFRYSMGGYNRLRIYTDDYFRVLAAKVNEKEEQAETLEEQEAADEASSQFFGRMDDAKMDKQGRMTLSARQLQHAGIKDEVAIVGKLRYIEIWSVSTWNKYMGYED